MAWIRELLSSANANGSRSNALQHLQWMIAAFLTALVACAVGGVRIEVLFLVGGILLLLIVVYIVTHLFFMAKNPDALRSEKFTIEKMAMERGLVGDSSQGMREIGSSDPPKGTAELDHDERGEQ